MPKKCPQPIDIPGQLWCPLCLEWDPSDSFRVLQCGHCFCGDCIDEWHTQKFGLCPYCRKEDSRNFALLDSPHTFTSGQVYLPEPPEYEVALEMERLVSKQIRRRNKTIRYLRIAASAIASSELKGARFKIAGSAAGLIGAGMAVAGITITLTGVGAPVGMPLAISGAAISGVGGMNVAGAIVTEAIVKNKKLNGVNEHLQSDYFHSVQLRIVIGRAARDIEFADRIKLPTQDALSLLGIFGKAAQVGTCIGAFVRTIILGVGRGAIRVGLNTAGLILAAVLIPIDIAQMVSSSIKIHKKTPSQVVQDLRNLASDLEEELWALLHENEYSLFENVYLDETWIQHRIIFASDVSQEELKGIDTLEELEEQHLILIDSVDEHISEETYGKLYKIWPEGSITKVFLMGLDTSM